MPSSVVDLADTGQKSNLPLPVKCPDPVGKASITDFEIKEIIITIGRTPSAPSQTRPARRFRKQSGGHDFQQVTPRRTEFKSLQPLRLNRESFFGCVQIQLINNDGVWSDSILTKSE